MESNFANIRSEILMQINQFLKQNNHKDSNITKFLTELKQIDCLKTINISLFENIVKNNLQNKRIYFIRHSESAYNLWRKQSIFNWSIFYQNTPINYDPQITDKGIRQSKNLLLKLEKQNNQYQFDIVFISPMTRTLQTFLNIKTCPQITNQTKLICTDLIRERLDTPCDVGSSLENVKQICNQAEINVNLLPQFDDNWWQYFEIEDYSNQVQKIQLENKQVLIRRVLLFFLYISFIKENFICIISHQNIYKIITHLENKFISASIDNAEIKEINQATIYTFLLTYIKAYLK